MVVLAIDASQQKDGVFAIFEHNKTLSIVAAGAVKTVAKIEAITAIDKPISISIFEPYVCVVERYGINGAVVDIRTGAVRNIHREDYHADVSSFSHAFVHHNGTPLLIHQTQWNRLDVMDLETGACLTNRRVTRRDEAERRAPSGGIVQPEIDEAENDLDYFHSRLHVAPDGQSVLSNGWAWSPVDNVVAFRVEEFLKSHEMSASITEFGGGYNWDRPCVFFGNDAFAVVVDNLSDGIDHAAESYLPLWLYRVSDRMTQVDKHKPINAYAKVPCDAFGTNEHGEVYGELYYDPMRDCLIAISDKGGFQLALNGAVIAHDPVVARVNQRTQSDSGERDAIFIDEWKYCVRGQFFYRFDNVSGTVECRKF